MRINLKKSYFNEREFILAQHGEFKVTSFRYSTGVEALRVDNIKGYFIILPFQGQQIWRAHFCGKDLTMRTKLDEPYPTKEYLKTHGGFLLHCGVCAFGVPQADDKHPHHGELPNADYDNAYIEMTDDYVEVGGTYNYYVSFVKNYSFTPRCRLYSNNTVLKINITLENKRCLPMDYMYLCHINFRPIDGAELIYSASCENAKVFNPANDDMPLEQKQKLDDYVARLEKDISIHHKIGADGQFYNPEICFGIYDYKADAEGKAYTLQYSDDGAFYVSHPVDVLPVCIRWISRSEDEQSLGMVLPATAEHLGYNHAKRTGQLKFLEPYGKISFDIECGYLDLDNSKRVCDIINLIK